ncbi:type III secretion system transcriptional activator InvF [Pandoraea terrae]
MWLLQPLVAPTEIAFQTRVYGHRVRLPAGWRGLVFLERGELTVHAGDLCFFPVRLEILIKLLAFLDAANPPERPIGGDRPFFNTFRLSGANAWTDRRCCEAWFLKQVLAPTASVRAMLAMLRRSENYGIIRFLLSESSNGGTLQCFCERYGVSYSHFRRLCRNALGDATKTALREWRMARSMLEVADRSASLTEIALRNGYSSSSHFSSEIRDLTGMSPKGITQSLRATQK